MASVDKRNGKPQLYTVQTWDKSGALTNSYDARIGSALEMRKLRAFLLRKSAHVVIALKGAR